VSTVQTLSNQRPPRRVDGVPWTSARLEEAASAGGTWTAIETFTLDPVDEDPAAPAAREFTTEATTLASGWYRIVWLDVDSDEHAGQPEFLGPPYQPSLADVARAMRSRIVDDLGAILPGFTASTVPSDADVADYIVDAADFLTARVGLDVANGQRRLAQRVCALRAAVDAERAIARGKDNRRAQDLQKAFEEELAALLDAPGAQPASYRHGSFAVKTIYTASS
jgi:hypothetical protein